MCRCVVLCVVLCCVMCCVMLCHVLCGVVCSGVVLCCVGCVVLCHVVCCVVLCCVVSCVEIATRQKRIHNDKDARTSPRSSLRTLCPTARLPSPIPTCTGPIVSGGTGDVFNNIIEEY